MVRKMERLIKLDALRGIAAVLVALFHLASYQTPMIMNRILDFAPSVARSYLLVDWFFILSGFVMAERYGKTFSSGVGKASMGKFVFRRFIRLYPLHFASLLFLIFLHWGFEPMLGVQVSDPFAVIRNKFTILSNALMLHSSGLGDQGCFNCTSWNYPSWSISVEWLCYFFIPGFLVLLSRSFKSAMYTVFILGAGVLFLVEIPTGHLDVASWQGLIRCAYGMGLGCILQRIYRNGLRLNGALHCGFWISAPFLIHFLPYDTLLVLALAPAIYFLACSSQNRFFGDRLLVWLGERSYSIYMLHSVVQDILSLGFRIAFNQTTQGASMPAQMLYLLCAMGLTLTLSDLSFRFIENPSARYLKKIGARIWRRRKLNDAKPALHSLWSLDP